MSENRRLQTEFRGISDSNTPFELPFLCFVYVIVSCLLLWTGNLKAEPVTEEMKEGAFRHAANIIEVYPPDKYKVIALGVGTPLIGSAMKVLVPNGPGYDHYYSELPVIKYQEGMRNLDKADRPGALDRIIPSPADLNGREVVIVYVVREGNTLNYLANDIQQYFRGRTEQEAPGRNGQPIHAYIIHDNFGETDDRAIDPLKNKMSTIFKGTMTFRKDPKFTDATVRPHQDDPHHISNFTRYKPFTPWHMMKEGFKPKKQSKNLKSLDNRMADYFASHPVDYSLSFPVPLSAPKPLASGGCRWEDVAHSRTVGAAN